MREKSNFLTISFVLFSAALKEHHAAGADGQSHGQTKKTGAGLKIEIN
jgi:hypothetical protein